MELICGRWHRKPILEWIRPRGRQFVQETIQAIKNIRFDEGFAGACLALAESRGKIITTGMGKAGHAARKSASTLCSLNFPAIYLHPGDASHGDSGLIEEGDILLAFSTSGKTREVIELIKLAEQIGVLTTIAVTSHPDAEIRKLCKIEVDMGIIKEAGYLNIAPTTSITVMLIVADMLATVAAELRGVSMEQFALHHHGGYLGRKCKYEIEKSKKA
jgi:arabinose-5-phosphate isomerase